MIRKSFIVVIEDDIWPNISCTIMHLDLSEGLIDVMMKKNQGSSSRESLYDTAETNFEVQVRNALGTSMRELFHDRKTVEAERKEPRTEFRRQSEPGSVAQTGAPVAPRQTEMQDIGRNTRSQTRASKNLSRTQKKR